MWPQELGTILLVAEDTMLSEYEEMTLEQLGYSVLTAKDELEAVMLYQDHWNEISLVILDVSMPVETYRELKRLDRGVNILLVMDQATRQNIARELLDREVPILLKKPYHVDELAEAVQQAFQYPLAASHKTASQSFSFSL